MGEKYGTESTTLTTANMPSHNHGVGGVTATMHATSSSGNSNVPTGKVLADDGADRIYRSATADVTMSSEAVSVAGATDATGGNLPVSTVPPSATLNCIIALQGIFPSRS